VRGPALATGNTIDRATNKGRLWSRLQPSPGVETRWGIAFAMPSLVGFTLLTLLPIGVAAVLSFTDYNVVGVPSYIGVANYEALAHDPLVIKSLTVTIYFALGAVTLTMLLGFALALLVSQRLPGAGIFRTIFYLPVLIPSIANAILWLWVFEPEFGLLNGMLRLAGIHGLAWVSDSRTVIPSIIGMNAWACGNMMIIFTAGLRQVPGELYDAVSVDGGGRLAQFRHVTLPILTPVIFFNAAIGVLGFFQQFSEDFIMTAGGPANASLFYVFFLYRTAFRYGELGYASALMFPFLLLIICVTGLLFLAARRWVYYAA
jgi:multiple sugar transport system permease protein